MKKSRKFFGTPCKNFFRKLYLMNSVRIKTEVIDDDIEIIHEIHEENEGRISPSEFLPVVKAKKIDWDITSNSSCRVNFFGSIQRKAAKIKKK
jgi:hypothetical protein